MKHTILLAGATGVVGSAVLDRLVAAGHRVRTLSRDPERAKTLRARGAWEVRTADATDSAGLHGIADGCDRLVSCLGANVGAGLAERRSYAAVDLVANRHLLEAARSAGVPRFVYTAVHLGPGYAHTRYIQAHERFIEELRAASLTSTVVRPTGIFTAFAPIIDMARKGRVMLLGDGTPRSNPVHPDDVADAVTQSLDSGPSDLPLGGPEVLSRREMVELIFRAIGRPAKITTVPALFPRLASFFLRPFHPRMSDLLQFVAAVFTHDCVAPATGTRRFEDYVVSG